MLLTVPATAVATTAKTIAATSVVVTATTMTAAATTTTMTAAAATTIINSNQLATKYSPNKLFPHLKHRPPGPRSAPAQTPVYPSPSSIVLGEGVVVVLVHMGGVGRSVAGVVVHVAADAGADEQKDNPSR